MPRPDDQTGAVPHLEAVNPGRCALTTACGPSRLRLAPSSWGQHLDPHDLGRRAGNSTSVTSPPATYCCSVTSPLRLTLSGSESTHVGGWRGAGWKAPASRDGSSRYRRPARNQAKVQRVVL